MNVDSGEGLFDVGEEGKYNRSRREGQSVRDCILQIAERRKIQLTLVSLLA